jgi:hypothetical protein
MRATRRLASLPLVSVPEGLEDRILAAAKEAQKVTPIKSPFARAVSWAGRKAMSPQIAMAAVFLLMIGSTAFVIRSKKAEAPQATAVSDWGAPAATIHAPASSESLDNAAAAAAHGAVAASPTTLPPAATATAMASSPPAFAANDEPAAGPMDRITGAAGRDSKGKDQDQALAALMQAQQQAQPLAKAESAKESEKKRAAASAPPASPPMARAGDPSNAGVPGGGAPYADYGGQTAPPPAQNALRPGSPQDGYSAGMAAYRARKYAEATNQFDGAAASGDLNAALWAAKAVKAGNGGCSVAIPRFDAVAQRTPGTPIGNEALYEAADCQIETGQLDTARARLTALLNTQTHRAQAQQALTKLNQVVARRAAEGERGGAAGGGAAAAPAKAAARPAPRAPAPAAKPAATADSLKNDSAY